MFRFFLAAAALGGFIGVALGAVGTHLLRGTLDAHLMEVFQTAVQYQLWHALALALVALLVNQRPESRLLRWSGTAFLAGVLLFSGSLYLRVAGWSTFVHLAPVGGLCLMAGWLLLAAFAMVRP